MMKNILPDKLSELIMVAVKDARKLDRTKYKPNARIYHAPLVGGGTCRICDAGAVMAGSLNVTYEASFIGNILLDRFVRAAKIDESDESMAEDAIKKLQALDWARSGMYVSAINRLTGNLNPAIPGVTASPYCSYSDWEEFDKHLEHMEGVAQQLKDLGY